MKKPTHERLDDKIEVAPPLFGQAAANVIDTMEIAALAYEVQFGTTGPTNPDAVLRILELMMAEASRLAAANPSDEIPL
jgi:hypothetical protein